MTKSYQSAHSVLSKLPPVMELTDVEVALDASREQASQYCWRWRKERMILPFAHGVYYNLVADPKARSTRIKEAVDRVVRRPVVLIGSSGLHAHGWTTQRAVQTQIAVPVSREVKNIRKMAGVVAEPRDLDWFHVVLPLSSIDTDGFLLPPPEYVLADMIGAAVKFESRDEASKARLLGKTIWHADPDDVDVGGEDAEDAVARIYEAGERIGVAREDLTEYMAKMDDLADIVGNRANGPKG